MSSDIDMPTGRCLLLRDPYIRLVCMKRSIESGRQISWDDLVSNSRDTKKSIAHTPEDSSRKAIRVCKWGVRGDAVFFLSWHDVQKQVRGNRRQDGILRY